MVEILRPVKGTVEIHNIKNRSWGGNWKQIGQVYSQFHTASTKVQISQLYCEVLTILTPGVTLFCDRCGYLLWCMVYKSEKISLVFL